MHFPGGVGRKQGKEDAARKARKGSRKKACKGRGSPRKAVQGVPAPNRGGGVQVKS